MPSIIKHPKILQKFYIYDPNVPDELGGLRVLNETDDKGNVKEGTKHVLAVQQQVQYWVDQGLLGEKPVGSLSGNSKKLLAQITRGRSEDNETELRHVPKYDKVAQSGSPATAGMSRKSAKKRKAPKKAPPKKTATRPAEPPKPPAA